MEEWKEKKKRGREKPATTAHPTANPKRPRRQAGRRASGHTKAGLLISASNTSLATPLPPVITIRLDKIGICML